MEQAYYRDRRSSSDDEGHLEEIRWQIKISIAKARIAMEESMQRLGRKLLTRP